MTDESDYYYTSEYYTSDESIEKKPYNTKKKILIEVESEIPDTSSRIKKLDTKTPAKGDAKGEAKNEAKGEAKNETKRDAKSEAKSVTKSETKEPVKTKTSEKKVTKEPAKEKEKASSYGGSEKKTIDEPVNVPSSFSEIKATPNPNYRPQLVQKNNYAPKQQFVAAPQAPPPSPANLPTPDPPRAAESLPPLVQKKEPEETKVAGADTNSQSDYYSGDYYSTDSYYYSSGVVKTDFAKLTRDLLAENYNFETLKKIYIECTQQCNPKHLSKDQRAFLDVLYGEMQKRGRCPPP
jgi:hypothetical protein